MKILFVSSGNNKFGISPIVYNQGESLAKAGIEVKYFPVKGNGIIGYLKASKKLRQHIRIYDADIIHAHYTLSGWSAVLAFAGKPVVLSLMGSDVYGEYIGVKKIKLNSCYLILLSKLIQPFVKKIICKSNHIENFVTFKKKSYVIPNGVFLDKIKADKNGYRNELGLKADKKYILFLGSNLNIRKNFQLAEAAVHKLNNNNVELIAPYPIEHKDVFKFMNSVDCIIVPSFMEGSPNVVKEAMACNCPVVATDVGDIKWMFGDELGHFITSFDPEDVAEKIKMALDFVERNGRTKGRERIVKLGLDSEAIARRIITIYKMVLSGK